MHQGFSSCIRHSAVLTGRLQTQVAQFDCWTEYDIRQAFDVAA